MKVLFVDDDQLLLNGLRRVFMTARKIQTLFAQSGQSGLELMEREHVDIVVADIRMPGMDGVAFLGEVQKRHPQTIRIVLSGSSDPRLAFQSIGVAHQFLSKPCDLNALKQKLGYLYELGNSFGTPGILELLSPSGSLPVLHETSERLLAELHSDSCAFENVASILAEDPGLLAGVFKAVNSSFFGIPHQMDSILQTVTYLGGDHLSSLVGLDTLFTEYDESAHSGFSLAALWQHCRKTALFARLLAQAGPLDVNPEKCFNCALLHDIGKLILLDRFAEKYDAVHRLSNAQNITVFEAEKRLLSISHAEVGAYVLGLWGFSESIVRAVFHHHEPEQCAGEDKAMLAVVHAANVFEHELVTINPGYALPGMHTDFLLSAGVDGDAIAMWRSTLQHHRAEGPFNG